MVTVTNIFSAILCGVLDAISRVANMTSGEWQMRLEATAGAFVFCLAVTHAASTATRYVRGKMGGVE